MNSSISNYHGGRGFIQRTVREFPQREMLCYVNAPLNIYSFLCRFAKINSRKNIYPFDSNMANYQREWSFLLNNILEFPQEQM